MSQLYTVLLEKWYAYGTQVKVRPSDGILVVTNQYNNGLYNTYFVSPINLTVLSSFQYGIQGLNYYPYGSAMDYDTEDVFTAGVTTQPLGNGTSPINANIVVSRISRNGTYIWFKVFGHTSEAMSYAEDVVFDHQSQTLYVNGATKDSFIDSFLNPTAILDTFIMKIFCVNGSLIDVTQYGMSVENIPNELVFYSDSIYLCGLYDQYAFISKLSSNLTTIWYQVMQQANTRMYDLSVSQNQIYAVGFINGQLDGIQSLNQDVMLTRWWLNGTRDTSWSNIFQESGSQTPLKMFTDQASNRIAVGGFRSGSVALYATFLYSNASFLKQYFLPDTTSVADIDLSQQNGNAYITGSYIGGVGQAVLAVDNRTFQIDRRQLHLSLQSSSTQLSTTVDHFSSSIVSSLLLSIATITSQGLSISYQQLLDSASQISQSTISTSSYLQPLQSFFFTLGQQTTKTESFSTQLGFGNILFGQNLQIDFLVLWIAAGAVLFLIMIFTCWCCIRYRKKNLKLVQNNEVTLSSIQAASSVQDTTFDITSTATAQGTTLLANNKVIAAPGFLQVKIGINTRFTDATPIAEGGGGVLRLADILTLPVDNPFRHSGITRCVSKQIKQVSIDSFLQEVSLMWYFNGNDCIVPIIGYSQDQLTIFMPYYEYGSLDKLIKGGNMLIDQWTVNVVISLGIDMATALQAIHDAGVVHNDIKSQNFLIDYRNKQLHVRLTDFGICTILSTTSAVKGLKWNSLRGKSVKYSPPESFGTANIVPSLLIKLDIYAFSVILNELMVRKMAWENVKAEEVAQLVLSGQRPQMKPLALPDDKRVAMIHSMIHNGWCQDPAVRPNATQLLSFLRSIV